MSLVVWSNGTEVLVTTPAHESKTLFEYFDDGGRDPDEYDRKDFENVVQIEAGALVVSGDREIGPCPHCGAPSDQACGDEATK